VTRTSKIVLITTFALVVIGLSTFLIVRRRKKRSGGFSKDKVLVCSHITNIDVAGSSNAQNNLKNIQLLLDNNVDIIEMDVQITSDGVPVLFHDNTLDEKTNGSGSIQNKSWAEVSQIRYNADTSQGITKLADAIELLKKSRKPTIFQLDKCDASEIQRINDLGLFKGVQDQMLAKAQSFSKSQAVIQSGIMYMPIIPSNYVGKMNNDATIDEIVQKCKGSQFLEAQFSDSDSKLIDGTLSKKLEKIGCRLLVVAVGGSSLTNGQSFRGDSKNQWAKMVDPMNAGAIMTNYPLKLKTYLNSIGK
jgi:glycerophosphoryl diester phosphodiesterase